MTPYQIIESEKIETKDQTELLKDPMAPEISQQHNFIRQCMDLAIKNLNFGDTATENWWSVLPQVHQKSVDYCKHLVGGYKNPTVAYAGSKNEIINTLSNNIEFIHESKTSVDILLAPHTIYDQMEDIFQSTEKLLQNKIAVEEHDLFKYFERLNEDGTFAATLNSGPNISDFTNLLLGKHGLHLSQGHLCEAPSLKIFNNMETFLRCFDIFKRYYELKFDKTIVCELSYSMPHIPLKTLCEKMVVNFPEIAKMKCEEREQLIRLISVFNIDDEVVDCNMTLEMKVVKKILIEERSFKPIDVSVLPTNNSSSNEISFAQQNLDQQIQNLKGADVAMPYIKEVDGAAQFRAMQVSLEKKHINMIDLGGGRGETNAISKAILENGSQVDLLNVEPYRPFAEPYIKMHQGVGIKNVAVLVKKAQETTSFDIQRFFNGQKADILLASHSFYFVLAEMHRFSLKPTTVEQHPLWSYFDMIKEDGVIALTLQSGAGARLFRDALLGSHGLNQQLENCSDQVTVLLKSFGNLATFLRNFEVFTKMYQKKTGKNISVKMHHAVANVPLGHFKIIKEESSGGYVIKNPLGSEKDPNWLAPKMLDFYGNWNELQNLALLSPQKIDQMSTSELENLGLQNLSQEQINGKTETARKTQETFLHILRVFAPAMVNMQHPNITLEIHITS